VIAGNHEARPALATQIHQPRPKIPRVTTSRQPDNRPANQPAYLGSTEAAHALGISLDALRKRINRGTIDAVKESGHWYIHITDNQPASNRTDDRPPANHDHVDGKELAIAAMEARITSLERQLEAREREVGQLHHLLAQTALNQATTHPWWRFWG